MIGAVVDITNSPTRSVWGPSQLSSIQIVSVVEEGVLDVLSNRLQPCNRKLILSSGFSLNFAMMDDFHSLGMYLLSPAQGMQTSWKGCSRIGLSGLCTAKAGWHGARQVNSMEPAANCKCCILDCDGEW